MYTPTDNDAGNDSIIRVNGRDAGCDPALITILPGLAGRAGMTTDITIHGDRSAAQCYENVHGQGVPRAPEL